MERTARACALSEFETGEMETHCGLGEIRNNMNVPCYPNTFLFVDQEQPNI